MTWARVDTEALSLSWAKVVVVVDDSHVFHESANVHDKVGVKGTGCMTRLTGQDRHKQAQATSKVRPPQVEEACIAQRA